MMKAICAFAALLVLAPWCSAAEAGGTSAAPREEKQKVVVIEDTGQPVATSTTSQAGRQVYRDEGYGFSIEFPDDWSVSKPAEGIVVTGTSPKDGPTDRFLQNVTVTTERVRGRVTAQQYEAAAQATLQAGGIGYRRVDEGSAEVGGKPARYLVYTCRLRASDAMVGVRNLAYFFVDGRTVFIVTCTDAPGDYAKHEAAFKEIVASFKFDAGAQANEEKPPSSTPPAPKQ